MRKAGLLIFVILLVVGYIGAGLEPELRTQAAGPTIDKDDPLGPLWPDRRVRYMIDPGVDFIQQTPSPLCSLHDSRLCELPLRQGINLAAETYQEQTSLTFENESGTSAPPAVKPNPEFYLRHDHPHLFFLQGPGGENYGYTKLRKMFRAWKKLCDAAPKGCTLKKAPDHSDNRLMNATVDDVLGWTYARDRQQIMRPDPGTPNEDYQWPLSGAQPLLPHGDLLITLPKRSLTTVEPGGQHYDEGALHEIGHALGMSHEQKRPDRDEAVHYFPCHLANEIIDARAFDNSKPAVKLSPYDISSIMQYESTSKCKKGLAGLQCESFGGQRRYPLLSKTWKPGSTIDDPNSGAHEITYDKCDHSGPATGYYMRRPGTLSPEDINILYQLHPATVDWDNEPDDRFGAAIAAGDFDGDHYADLAIGAPGEADLVGVNAGAVYVFKGTYTGLVPWRKLVAPYGHRHRDDAFGAALAADDLDGDGYAELVVGAPQAHVGGASSGAAWLFDGTKLGPQTAQATALTIFGDSLAASPAGQLGAAIVINNLDGLGNAEIAVGAPGREAVYVFRSDGKPFTKLSPTRAASVKQYFGAALAAGRLGPPPAGPGRKNAPADLLIGAPGGPGNTAAGALYVSRGGAKMGPPTRVSLPNTAADGDGFGATIVTGQFSTAGTTQVAVGAPGHSNRMGRVFVLSIAFNARGGGITTTLHQTLGRNDLRAAGDLGGLTDAVDAQFGRSLAVVPSVAGPYLTPSDGLAVGMPGTPPPGSVSQGTVGFFAGSRDATPALKGMAATLSQPAQRGRTDGYQQFGLALAAGDFNRQPGTELAIAAPGKTDETGAVWVALSGTPPTFGLDKLVAPDFAVFLDQEHVYNHWPRP